MQAKIIDKKSLRACFSVLLCPTMSDTLRTKSVRLSQDQIDALVEFAKRDSRDVSQVIRIAIDEFFAGQKTNGEIKIPAQHTEVEVPA
jgi:hypothetical protein